jgi:hypothetical protein
MSETQFMVSMVGDATSVKTRDADAAKIIESIRSGRWRSQVDRIRADFDRVVRESGDVKAAKTAVDAEKKRLPAALFSGTFTSRKKPTAEKLVAHSGLLCADLDNLGERRPAVRARLETSDHLFALFTSPTGNGLKAIFRVPCDGHRHHQSFRVVQAHVRHLCGEEIDESCKDVSRICFVSYDPELFYNAVATQMVLPSELPSSESAASVINNTRDLQQRRIIAERNLGCIGWEGDDGFCACPGKHLHTTPEGERDCRVKLDGVPTISCFHEHCKGIVAGVNHELRSQIAKAEKKGNGRRSTGRKHGSKASHDKVKDDEAIERLAKLSPLEFDRCAASEAEALGVNILTLRREVERTRPKNADANLQGSTVLFESPALWPEPVVGADVLDQVSNVVSNYVALSASAADVLALWVAHAHIFDAFLCSPRLHVTSPEKQCGKTTLRDLLALLVPRPLPTENLTLAVLFRAVQAYRPTVLADECDAWLRENEDLRGLLNSGHRQGGRVFRCEGDSHELRGFNVFAPAVLCGIGALPGTLHDRSIVIRLERAKPGEVRHRFDSRKVATEQELCRQLARFTNDNRASIEECDPLLPPAAHNRVADNWRPLFVLAQIAGGDWLERIGRAFAQLVSNDDADAHGIGTMLLADIRDAFSHKTTDRLLSKELVRTLCSMKERPWPEARNGNEITENWLARRLRPFGITPKTLRTKTERAKGYERGDFLDAFERYLHQIAISEREERDKVMNSSGSAPPASVTSGPRVTGADGDGLARNNGLSQCHGSSAHVQHAIVNAATTSDNGSGCSQLQCPP